MIALSLGLALTLPGLTHAGACGGGGPGVFASWGTGGKIAIGNDYIPGATSPCLVSFTGSEHINVAASGFVEPTWIDTANNNAMKPACSVLGAAPRRAVPTGVTLDRYPLPAFPTDARAVDIKYTHPDAFISVGDDTSGDPQGCINNASATCRPYQFITSGRKWKRWPDVQGNDPSYTSDDGAIFPSREGDPLIISNLNQRVYDEIYSQAAKLYFKYDGTQPYVINSLTFGNSGTEITFEPGDYYFNTFSFTTTVVINVADKDSQGRPLGNGSGRVNIYVKNADNSTFVGSGSCLNIDGVTTTAQCTALRTAISPGGQPVVNLDAQHPEKLAFWFYNGKLTLNDTVFVAASIYNDDPAGEVFFRANNNTTFVGEILSKNIQTLNQGPVYMHYKDTGAFSAQYANAVIPRTGEYSLAPPALPRQGLTGDYAYIPYQTDTPSLGGHLKAFALKADGTTSTTAAWDADDEMTVAERQTRLYSTDANGNLTLFNNLDAAAFGAGTSPTVAQIKAYTLNPNDSNGAYLAGRDPNGLIGRPHTTQPVILGSLVLFHTDDGFLYAVDKTTGELKWGYMPRPLVAGLKNYASFFKTHPMEGQIAVLPDSDGSTAGYVVGSAKGGALHYALRVNSDGSLDSQVWLDERAGSNPHRPLVMKVGATAYAMYVAESTKVIRRALATNPAEAVFDLSTATGGVTLTGAPIAVESYTLNNQNAREQNIRLFLGDAKGNAWTAPIVSGGAVTNSLPLSRVGNIGTGSDVADPVLWLEHATKGGANYLTVMSKTRLKTFKYPEADPSWRSSWTSYAGGSGYWNEAGTSYTAETTFTPKAVHIQKLPDTGATITGKAEIAAGVVFLPVQYETNTVCDAYLYLYRLDNGKFPSNALYFKSIVTDNVKIGTGTAYTPTVTMLNGRLVLEGHSEQNLAASTGMAPLGGLDNPFEFVSPSAGGPSGWRELVNE
ncbi:MAG: hypothetical protein AB1713_07380 [Pseudomonadota bacterium]